MAATTISRLAQTLQDVLTTQANRLARASGFVQRESKLTGALFVQTLVFGFLRDAHRTWDQLAQMAALLGVPITGSGLHQRCTFTAARFLLQVLEGALAASLNIHAAPVALPILQRFSEVYLLDSTHITLPAALAALWPAASAAATHAVLKLQVRLSVLTGALHVALCAGGISDQALPPAQTHYRRGSLRLADLGYFNVKELAQLAEAGVYWLTHMRFNTALYTPAESTEPAESAEPAELVAGEQRWTLLAFLEAHHAQATRACGLDQPIQLGVQAHLACRLLVQRVPRAAAAELRRRLYAQARDKGTTVSAAQVELTRWVIFVTNVPADRLTLQEALVLARVRWQIELLFKLWKSHGAIDASHRRNASVIMCEVYAKLLAMVVQHWTFVVGLWQRPERSWVKAAAVVRDLAPTLAHNFARPRRLRETLRTLVATLGIGCTITKRKGVPATFQLLLALAEFP